MIKQTLLAVLFTGFVFGCSSSKSTNEGVVTDDSGTEDTMATEDTAPWNTYPPGPYGLERGNIFPNLTFKGYKEGTGEWTDISMNDYYDPTGERGITGIYFVAAAQWCPPCNEEADFMPGWYTKDYKARGARFISSVIQDIHYKPATQTTVDEWITKHKINFDIVVDGNYDSVPKTSSLSLPHNYVINPRNMQILRIPTGVDGLVVTKCTANDTCCPDGSPCYKCSGSLGNCLGSTMKGPVEGLDALMNLNGAKPFDVSLMP